DRKAAEEAKKNSSNGNSNLAANYAERLAESNANKPVTNKALSQKKSEDDLELNLYLDSQSITFYVRVDASDADVVAEAERIAGKALTEEQKKQVKFARQSSYAGRFSTERNNDYEGGYF